MGWGVIALSWVLRLCVFLGLEKKRLDVDEHVRALLAAKVVLLAGHTLHGTS